MRKTYFFWSLFEVPVSWETVGALSRSAGRVALTVPVRIGWSARRDLCRYGDVIELSFLCIRAYFPEIPRDATSSLLYSIHYS
jgi:hypothetical protein